MIFGCNTSHNVDPLYFEVFSASRRKGLKLPKHRRSYGIFSPSTRSV